MADKGERQFKIFMDILFGIISRNTDRLKTDNSSRKGE